MKYIGAHVSIAGGIFNAPLNAEKIGAKAFAMFTKNQRQWHACNFTLDEITQFKINLKKSAIKPEHVLPHDSYLINIGSPDAIARKKSLRALIAEVERCDQLGLKLLNIHPGSHLNQINEQECLNNIAESINAAITQTENIIIVLENTAGQGGNVGYKLEHLEFIINKIKNKKRIGVCIDTCHIFASGYDIQNKENYTAFWHQFEKLIGFEYLKGMHINDSKSTLASRVDRHQSLGEGHIGLECFELLMQDKRLDNIPLILETPDPDKWPSEIKLLYKFTQ